MIEAHNIEVTRRPNSRIHEVDFNNLPFGREFTDHMLIATYANGSWSNAKIIPYGNLPMSPAMSAIHYGQSIFEGMKAYRNDANKILIFRPEANWKRMNNSAERLCMPTLPKEIFVDGLRHLIDLDRDWVPSDPTCSLYIRPFMFATESFLGVKASETYTFAIICSPVGPYYARPLHVKIETHYTRAAMGGVGFAKAAGNYASTLLPARLAQQQGIDQLVWTDAKEHAYVEEAGTMNMMVVMDDVLITPPLTSTILPGITRDSFLTLAREANFKVEERKIAVLDLIEGIKNGSVSEVFGVGTAATIAHVIKLSWEDKSFDLPPLEGRVISNKIGNLLFDIKKGIVQDTHGWNLIV